MGRSLISPTKGKAAIPLGTTDLFPDDVKPCRASGVVATDATG
jgi:hypothetical protein